MSHPRDLRAFALGMLADHPAAEVATHVRECRRCRRHVRRFRREAAAAVDRLPPANPDPELFQRVSAAVAPRLAARRTHVGSLRRSRAVPLAAAAVAVLVCGILAAGLSAATGWRQALERTERERAVVAAWLTREDITTWRLDAAPGERSPGSVLVADDGAVLAVLRSPPRPGSRYGLAVSEATGERLLVESTGTVLRAEARGLGEVSVVITSVRAGVGLVTLGRAPVP